jgi:hypothetical protein
MMFGGMEINDELSMSVKRILLLIPSVLRKTAKKQKIGMISDMVRLTSTSQLAGMEIYYILMVISMAELSLDYQNETKR